MIQKTPKCIPYDANGSFSLWQSVLGGVSAVLLSGTALAGPVGGNVVGGAADIAGQGTANVIVNQSSQRVVIEWQNMDVQVGESLQFNQPNAHAVALNKIQNGSPTKILGSLKADGRVIVMNPNGVILGAGATIDVAGLVATTANVDTDKFMNADMIDFDQAGDSDAKIINEAQITVKEAGLVGFVAPQVENNGVIEAEMGKVHLASGDTFTLDLAGDELVNIAISDHVAQQMVKNTGVIEGGKILMTAKAARDVVDNMVINTGVLEASSVSQKGGKIILGGDGTQIIHEGTIRANGLSGGHVEIAGKSISTNGVIEAKGTSDQGGTVIVKAETSLESMAGTVIDVSGTAGGAIIQNASGSVSSGSYIAEGLTGAGGTIDWGGNVSLLSATLDVGGQTEGGTAHLGGVWQNPTSAGWDAEGVHLDAATNIVASQGTKILAQAKGNKGSGGEIVLRAQEKTVFGGEIDTTPGAESGAGGRTEISGGTIDLIDGYNIKTGIAGRNGTLLLDPQNIIIGALDDIDALSMVKLAFGYSFVNSEFFGYSSALNDAGNLLAVGAYGNDTGGTDRGAVYLFGLDPDGLKYSPVFYQRITHGTAGITLANANYFGYSVALNGSGSVLAVGARGDDTGGTDRGAVYLLGLDTDNLKATPTYERKLRHGIDGISLVNSNFFGAGVALNTAGDILAVGANGDDTGGTDRGAVHLLSLDPLNLSGAATYQKKLAHGTGVTLVNSDNFGLSVALNGVGDMLAVGAFADDTGGTNRGAAYLFSLDTNNLTANPVMERKIAHGTAGLSFTNTTYFGYSVALNNTGDILAVGAQRDDTGGTDRGAVYLFDIDPSNPSAVPVLGQKIAHGSGVTLSANSDYFGTSVALNGVGDMLAIGAYGDDTGGSARGAAYLFRLDETDLTIAAQQKNKLHNNNPGLNLANSDYFGVSSALNNAGNILAVGAHGDDTGGSARGAVYLFEVDETDLAETPVFRYKLGHGVGGLSLVNADSFGIGVALNGAGNVLAVGAHAHDTGGTDRGAAFLFGLDTNNLSLTPVLGQKIAHGTDGLSLLNSNYFGVSVALNNTGDILAVGAHGDDTGGADRGAVYLFNIDANNLAVTADYQKKIAHGVSGITLVNSDNFGRAVALNGDGSLLVVGASGDDTGGAARGAAYILGLDPTDLSVNPTYGIKLAHGTAGLSLVNSDTFGVSLALNDVGNLLAVGAMYDDTGGTDRGAVYLFSLDPANPGTVPVMEKKIAHGSSGVSLANDVRFGISVALNGAGDILSVGAYTDDTGGTDRGAVYLMNVSGVLTGSNQAYDYNPATDVNFTPAMLASLLNSGNNVTLQANNDITLASDLLLNNPGGDAGDLTLQAGRSVLLNANIDSDNGNVTVIANDVLASGVVDAYRLIGAGGITMASGTSLNAGTGRVSLITRDGAGKTYNESGNTMLETISAGSVLVETSRDIALNGVLSADDSGDALVMSGRNLMNNVGAGALDTPSGRYLVYLQDDRNNTLGGLNNYTALYHSSYSGNPPASVAQTGNVILYPGYDIDKRSRNYKMTVWMNELLHRNVPISELNVIFAQMEPDIRTLAGLDPSSGSVERMTTVLASTCLYFLMDFSGQDSVAGGSCQ